jgi:hypothetical protein
VCAFAAHLFGLPSLDVRGVIVQSPNGGQNGDPEYLPLVFLPDTSSQTSLGRPGGYWYKKAI